MNSNHPPRKPANVPPPVVIDTADALWQMTEQISQEPRIAVDTEANSMYVYREQVCLIQISIPGVNYLVDPLALDDLDPLGPILCAPHIEKVFHAADYDQIILKRDFDFDCHPIFDTMWAARILGWPRVGLANILESHYDVHPNKRYQRYNWGKRPLDAEALTYAWMDSYYLLDLQDTQKDELLRTGRWEEAREIFHYLCHTVHVPPEPTLDELFWRIKGVYDLHPHEQRVLYQLHLWREAQAERLDRPPTMVISNRRLIQLARVRPRHKGALADAGLSQRQIRRFGSSILRALKRTPYPDPPPHEQNDRAPADVVNRYHTLKDWRKHVAARRGVDSDVILPNAVLWKIAWNVPQTLDELRELAGIGPWREAHYGPDILKLLR